MKDIYNSGNYLELNPDWADDEAPFKFENLKRILRRNIPHILTNTKEIKIWLLAIEKEEGLIKISIRSSRYVINEVAEKYSGGGHKFAAGAKIKKWAELDNLINDLDKLNSQ